MAVKRLVEQLDYFFKARTVAVIGASSTPGKIGYEIFRSLSQYDFKGKVYPINPKAHEIFGIKCYPSILDVPDKIDLAVIALPSEIIPKLIEECGQKGVKACVIVSGGFKELGEKYEKIEEETVATAKKYGIRIIGPNCIGIFNSETKIDTFFQSHERMLRPPPGPISFITQSGTFGCTMLEWAAESGLGISRFISYGNRCDIDEADLIRYLGEDPNTKVIAIYVEGFGDGRKFLEAARNVMHRKPIVVLKAGRTELGSKAALSHTGWLAGSYTICEAALRQFGIIIAQNFEELFDMTKALAMQPPAKGKRIAMVTNGAGPCVMAIDECVERKIELATYSEDTVKKLKEILPPFCIIGNPVDLTGSATSNEYKVSMEMLLKDPNVDLLMSFFVFQDTPLDENIVNIVPEMQRYGKPIICCASGGPYTRKQSRTLEEKGVPVYPTPERAVAAAYALIVRGHTYSSGAGKVKP
jgi:3-hydroxypropionyl-CoA synthetase (ADP-forming)